MYFFKNRVFLRRRARENQALTKKNKANKGFGKLLLIKKFSVFLAVFLVFNVFFAAAPAIAKSGKGQDGDEGESKIISFFSRIFSFEEKNGQEENERLNITTLPLLEAPKNSDPAAGQLTQINIVDQSAILASAGPAGTIADIQNIPSTQISLYTVRQGDTLSGIAEMFNVDVNTIRFANDLRKGQNIKIGQQLVILPIPGVHYTVKKGDTLKLIAKKLGADEEEILNFNGLDSDKDLAAGDMLIVPNGELAEILEPGGKTLPGQKGKNYANQYPVYSGYYLRPTRGGIKSQGIHGYNGVDIALSCGEPIYASASGDVILSRGAGYNGGYGKYVVIAHPNGTQTLYAHNSSNAVVAGEHVAQGEIVGYIGNTGRSTGCHVHFEIRGAKNPF